MRQGFTLIETVVYIALISVILTMTLLAMFQLLETKNRLAVRLEAEGEADFLMGKINWVLTGARSVAVPAAGATSTVLTVEKFNFTENPITIELTNGVAEIQYGGGAPTALTSGSVIVRELLFKRIAGEGNPAVKITLSVDINPAGQYLLFYQTPTVLETTIALRTQ